MEERAVLGHRRGPGRGDHRVEVEVGAPRSAASSSTRDTVNGVRSSISGCTRRRAAIDAVDGSLGERLHPAEVDRRVLPAVRAGEVDELAAGQEVRQRTVASASISAQAASVIGALSRIRWFTGNPRCRCAGCRCRGCRWSGSSPCSASVLGGVLDGEDVAVGEQVGTQVAVEHRVVAAEPLERHRRVLLLLVPVVAEHLGQLGIGGGRSPLVVPVDRLELLHDRHDGPMAIDDRRRADRAREGLAVARHRSFLPPVTPLDVHASRQVHRTRAHRNRAISSARARGRGRGEGPAARLPGGPARPGSRAISPGGAPADADLDEGAHDAAHHLVAERVGLDLEAEHAVAEVVPPGRRSPVESTRPARRRAGDRAA